MPLRLRLLGARVGRLALFVLLVTAGLQLLLGRMVRAATDSSLLQLGSGLAQLGAATGAGDGRVVEINGARVRFAVHTRDGTVAAALDEACAPAGAHAMRGDHRGRGFVVCSMAPAPAGPVVGEVRSRGGSYRYLYAQPDDTGTLTVSVELDRSLDPAALFPAGGDAPGSDPPDVPRPPDARRLMSARELGSPQQITMYVAGDRAPAALEAWYRIRLPALGWRLFDGERKAGRPRVLLAERAGTLAALALAPDPATGGASVVILTALDGKEEGK